MALKYTDAELIQLTYGKIRTRPTKILLDHEFAVLNDRIC